MMEANSWISIYYFFTTLIIDFFMRMNSTLNFPFSENKELFTFCTDSSRTSNTLACSLFI